MKYSFIVPVYNAQKFIKSTIESLINQSYSNLEIILINDGSTDESLTICNEMAKTDERIQVYSQTNSGPLQARLYGLNYVKGDYVFFVDSDDYIKLDALEMLNLILLQDKSIDILIFNHDIVNMEDNLIRINKHIYSGKEGLISKENVLRDFLTTNRLNSLCFKVIKADIANNDILSAYECQHLIQGEDFLQLLPMMLLSKTFYYLDKTLYSYRTNLNSTTFNFSMKNLENIININEMTEDILNKYGSTYLRWFHLNRGKKSVGLYLRYVSFNKTTLSDKYNVIDRIKCSKVFINSYQESPLKDKIYYGLIFKKRIIILSLLVMINKIRLKMQRRQ